MFARWPLVPAALLFVGAIVAPIASAGTVAGKLELPPSLADLPILGRGFLPRLDNPHLPVRTIDPRPAMVVVLESSAAVAVKPATVPWDLLGDSFARPVLAAHVGDAIEIRNQGHSAPILVATGQPALLPKKPLNPTDRVAFSPTGAGLIEIVDESTPHLRGRVLMLERGRFAYVDSSGRFEFPDVEPGDWTVRVYYAPRNLAGPGQPATTAGWIDRVDDSITVGSKKSELVVKLPPALPVKP
jgi:hypothetical protein